MKKLAILMTLSLLTYSILAIAGGEGFDDTQAVHAQVSLVLLPDSFNNKTEKEVSHGGIKYLRLYPTPVILALTPEVTCKFSQDYPQPSLRRMYGEGVLVREEDLDKVYSKKTNLLKGVVTSHIQDGYDIFLEPETK